MFILSRHTAITLRNMPRKFVDGIRRVMGTHRALSMNLRMRRANCFRNGKWHVWVGTSPTTSHQSFCQEFHVTGFSKTNLFLDAVHYLPSHISRRQIGFDLSFSPGFILAVCSSCPPPFLACLSPTCGFAIPAIPITMYDMH